VGAGDEVADGGRPRASYPDGDTTAAIITPSWRAIPTAVITESSREHEVEQDQLADTLPKEAGGRVE